MKDSISVEEARGLVEKHLKQDYLKLHSRETEVIMRALARKFGEDEEFWGLCGLLHDLDMEETVENLPMHGKRTAEILREEGYELPEMFRAIESHSENLGHTDVKRENRLEYCLSAAENLTGLISAYVLMRPDKKIEGVKPKSIKKKFKDKSFAAKVNRQLIADIDKAVIELNDFFQIAIDAMKDIADELGM